MLLTFSLLLNATLVAGLIIAMDKMGGVRYLLFKLRVGGGGGMGVGREEHLVALDGSPRAGHIVFLGDSLTEAAEWSEMFGPGVVNRGIGGDSTQRILERSASIARTQPAKVFIMAGINDLVSEDAPPVIQRYRRIVETFRSEAPEAIVYIQSTLPVNNAVRFTGRDNAQVACLNDALRQLAEGDPRLRWVDLRPALTDASGNLDERYTFDGVHLRGPAYDVWRSAIAPHVLAA